MTQLRALVCDDEAPLRELMARRVQKLGLQVDQAEDGQAGLSLIGSHPYDLIVTDIYMPQVTGLELLEAAKKQDREVQVVIVTATATVENAIEAINLGAFCYLTKPFDHLSVFDNAILRAVELRRLTVNARPTAGQPGGGAKADPATRPQPTSAEPKELKELRDLMSSLPFGLIVVREGGEVSLSTPLAKSWLEQEVRTGRRAIHRFLETAPAQEGQVEEEVRLGQRTIVLSAADSPNGGGPRRKVVMLREKGEAASAPSPEMVEAVSNLKEPLLQLARLDLGEMALEIIRAMALQVADLERQVGIRDSLLGKVTSAPSPKAVPPAKARVEKTKSHQARPSIKPDPVEPPEFVQEESTEALPLPEPALEPEPAYEPDLAFEPEPAVEPDATLESVTQETLASVPESDEPAPPPPVATRMLQKGAAMFGKGGAKAVKPPSTPLKPIGDTNDEVERQAREAVQGFIARVAREEDFDPAALEEDEPAEQALEDEPVNDPEEMLARLGAFASKREEPWPPAEEPER